MPQGAFSLLPQNGGALPEQLPGLRELPLTGGPPGPLHNLPVLRIQEKQKPVPGRIAQEGKVMLSAYSLQGPETRRSEPCGVLCRVVPLYNMSAGAAAQSFTQVRIVPQAVQTVATSSPAADGTMNCSTFCRSATTGTPQAMASNSTFSVVP